MSEIYFLKTHAVSEVEKLVPDLFLCFKKTLCKVKESGQHFSFKMVW